MGEFLLLNGSLHEYNVFFVHSTLYLCRLWGEWLRMFKG